MRDSSDFGFFFSTRAGRALLSGFLLYTVVAVLVWNLPDARLRRPLIDFVTPFIIGLSLDQGWDLFSPDPQQRSIYIEVRMEFADGTSETWEPAAGGPFLGLYRGYRWKKWASRLPKKSNAHYWEGAASFFVRRYADDPRGLRSVALVTRWSDSPEIGRYERTWHRAEFFRLAVAAREVDRG